jgi:hypothetical protein
MLVEAALVEAAKSVAIENELARRGVALKHRGRELVGPCPVCGGRDRFNAHIDRQLWLCRHCRQGGDVIDLVRHLDDISFTAAVETLTGEKPQRKPTRTFMTRIANDASRERRQREKANWLWAQRLPIADSVAETYLRAARGYRGPLPPTLGFLAARADGQHPAMIAGFGIPDEPEPGALGELDDVDAVHLTLLQPHGGGKADVEKPKLFVGRPLNAPIVLAPANDLLGLAITEGIEDGLSVHIGTGLGVWVAGSAGRIPALAENIPDYIESVTIWAHDDAAGARGGRELTDLLAELGIEVRMEGIP